MINFNKVNRPLSWINQIPLLQASNKIIALPVATTMIIKGSHFSLLTSNKKAAPIPAIPIKCRLRKNILIQRWPLNERDFSGNINSRKFKVSSEKY